MSAATFYRSRFRIRKPGIWLKTLAWLTSTPTLAITGSKAKCVSAIMAAEPIVSSWSLAKHVGKSGWIIAPVIRESFPSPTIFSPGMSSGWSEVLQSSKSFKFASRHSVAEHLTKMGSQYNEKSRWKRSISSGLLPCFSSFVLQNHSPHTLHSHSALSVCPRDDKDEEEVFLLS